MRLGRTLTVAAALVLVALPISAQRPAGIVHSATGHGSVTEWLGEPYYDQWSFSAVRQADGRTKGQVQINDREYDYFVHARVIDLKVEGNRAKVSAVFPEKWTCTICAPGFRPTHLFFVVADNGEGGETLDEISYGWWADPQYEDIQELIAMSPQEFVDFLTVAGVEPPLFKYFHGNIQVR